MEIYKHKQVGKNILWPLAAAAAFIIAILIRSADWRAPGGTVIEIVLVVLLASMVLFGSLTAEVTEDRLSIWFGPGVIRRSFKAEDIRAARIVRNRWYYGWGMRLTPYGWLWNVSGLDAIELELKNDTKFRIGTDEPQALLAAIQELSRFVG